ncbi:MAG: response regulator [Aeromonadaceae bacterium]
MIRVLLVDDDVELCHLQADYLQSEGFTVEQCHDGASGLKAALSGEHDILLLDQMLPQMSGSELLRRLRQHSNLPVLMLTAKGDDVDRILGLEIGADDYVAKPCTPRELVARIRAILRRSAPNKLGHPQLDDVKVGALRLSSSRRLAYWQGERLELTSTEFNLLESLCRHVGQSLSKAQLSELVLGRPLTRYDRSLDVHISNLRQKLGERADGRSPIETIRGIGYQLLGEDE